mgnify:CR=1 FL=1
MCYNSVGDNMKYNEEYGRYVTKEGLVYYYDKRADKLVLCKQCIGTHGYCVVQTKKRKTVLVHRLVWETFNGPIPDGLQIDHQDTHKDNNALSNLKLCTGKENMSNPLTKQHLFGRDNAKGKPTSEFGRKFKEHYGLSQYQDMKLYKREFAWYKKYKKCRWEL